MTSRNIYDNWERLVEAVIRRQQIWELCHAASSSSPSMCSDDSSSDFSFPSPVLLPPDPPKHHLSSNSSTSSQPVNKPELQRPATQFLHSNIYLEIENRPREISIASTIPNQCEGIRCPSIIARLMGLETSPHSSTSKPQKKPHPSTSETANKLKMIEFDVQSKDLAALKQILDDWPLKGLLQSGRPSRQNPVSRRNNCFDLCDNLRASQYLLELDFFLSLEKQECKVFRLQRKPIFDTIIEMLYRNKRLSPWKDVSWTNYDVTNDTAEDLFESICGAMKKDLAGDGITGWKNCVVEIWTVIFGIEWLIFDNLISETVRDLLALASRNTLSSTMPRM